MAADGGGSLEGASPVVSSAPPPTPGADDLISVGVVTPPDDGEDGPLDPSDGPSTAERLRNLRSDSSGPRKARGAPSEAELTTFFGERVLRWLMIGYISWLCSPLEVPTDDQARFIASKDDRKLMVAPLARVMAQSDLNARIGRKVLDADDVIDALITMGLWIDSTRPLMKARAAAVAEQRQRTAPATPIRQEAPHEQDQRAGESGTPAGVIPGPWQYGGGAVPGGSGA